MSLHLCWLLGHSRGPASDRIETERITPTYARVVRYCRCCGKRADGFSLVRKVPHSDIIPRGYGVAWVRWGAQVAIAMPIPLNLIAGGLYRLRSWAKVPGNLACSPSEAYHQGYRAGLEQANKEQP